MFKSNSDLLNMEINKYATIYVTANHYFTRRVYFLDGLLMVARIVKSSSIYLFEEEDV